MPKCYESRQMNIRQFIAKLNRHTEPFSVYNETKDVPTQTVGSIVTSGLWLAKCRLPENGSNADVRIIWEMNPKTNRFDMTPWHWKRRRFYFYELLMHELIHRHQGPAERRYRVRADDRETKESQEYYGTTTEIETHAHESALELKFWWPQLSFTDALREAKNFKHIRGSTPPTFTLYTTAFAECPTHPAVAHFKRKMRGFYRVIEQNMDFYASLKLESLVT